MSASNTGLLQFQHKNIMLITLHLSTAVSMMVSEHLCTRPRTAAPGPAAGAGCQPTHADRRKSAAPGLRPDSRHTCGRPAIPRTQPLPAARPAPHPPAPTHPTPATQLPFLHFLAVFSCHTRVFMLYNIFSATQQRKALQFRALLVNNSRS